ncbi:MAG: phage tail protein [Tannerellaceae bacterium]|nr:phage tail protein [Tannerellaceae bacterium]
MEETDIYRHFQVAFYFQVDFIKMKVNTKKEKEEDSRESLEFKEVSGLSRDMETETIYEGGSNNMEYKLPKRIKYHNLILKKALVLGNSGLVDFLKTSIEGDFTQPFPKRDIQIRLLDGKGTIIHLWRCEDAYPVKWEISSLDAEKSELVIEHLEFAYTTLKRN